MPDQHGRERNYGIGRYPGPAPSSSRPQFRAQEIVEFHKKLSYSQYADTLDEVAAHVKVLYGRFEQLANKAGLKPE